MALYPFTTAALTSLTSAGTTNSIKVNAQAVSFQVTVSSISTNVILRFEGSLDNTNFANLDEEALDTTITANGTTIHSLSGTPVEYVRLRLVSISGGSPTVATVVGAL
tara:strand:- start:4663 stop:4986 length:324 start_codon:yes stop_codon:yes gene_type:complete